MEIGRLTTVYDARDDQHRAVNAAVQDRERRTTDALKDEQTKRARNESSQWNYTLLGSANADKQRTQHALEQEAELQASRAAAVKRAEQEIERTTAQSTAARGRLLQSTLGALGFGQTSQQFSQFKGVKADVDALAEAEKIAGAEASLLSGGLGAAATTASSFAGAILPAVAILLGATAVIGGVTFAAYELAKGASEAGSRLHDLSAKTGISVEDLSALDYAAKLSGTTLERLVGSVVIFNRNLDAARHGTGRAKDAFKALGVDLNDDRAALNAVLDHLNALPPGAQRSAEAMKYFGRSGTEVLKILEETGGSLDKLKVKLRASGMLISTQEADAADRFGDSVDRIRLRMESMERHIGNRMIPAFQVLLDIIDDDMQRGQQSIGALDFAAGMFGQELVSAFALIKSASAPFISDMEYLNRLLKENFNISIIPTPKPRAAPGWEPTTVEEADMMTAQYNKDYLANAERNARALQAEQERLHHQGAISATAAAQQEIASSRQVTRVRIDGIKAEITALEHKRDEIDDIVTQDEKTGKKRLEIQNQIKDKQQKIRDEEQKLEQESRSKLDAAREEDLSKRREHINSLVGISRREIDGVYSFNLHAAQQSYDKGLKSLSDFNSEQLKLLAARHAGEVAALAKERTTLDLIINPEERLKAERDINQREKDADRQYRQEKNDIIINGAKQERELRRQAFDQILQLEEQMDAVYLQRVIQAADRGERTREEVETQRFESQRQRLLERLAQANKDAIFAMRGAAQFLPDTHDVLDNPEAMANRLAFKDFSFPGVDTAKVKKAQLDIQKILKEIEQAELEHNDKEHDARQQDLNDTIQYANDLMRVSQSIKDINNEILRSNIDYMGNFPTQRDAQRTARQAMDQAMENARFIQTLNEANDRIAQARLIKNKERARETEELINEEIEAMERQHNQHMLDIDRKYDEERRQDMLKMADDLAGILTAGLDSFQGNWSDIWRGMLQEALNVLRQVADELLKMSFEVLLTGQTKGSGAGGLLGTLINSIGGAIFGSLFGGGSFSPKGGTTIGTGGKIGGFAGGGSDVTGWAITGERGPELSFFGRPTQIFSNEESRRMVGGKVENNYYHISTPPMQQRSYVQKRAARESAEMISGLVKTRGK